MNKHSLSIDSAKHWRGCRRTRVSERICAGKMLAIASLVLLSLVIVSCTTGPDYQRPELRTPDQFKSANGDAAAQSALRRDWWRLFNDSELDALVEEALRENQDLKAAMARVAQARASTASVKSAFFPVISMDPSATRSYTAAQGSSATAGSNRLSEAATVLNQVTTLVEQINSLATGTAATQGTGAGAASTSGSADTIAATTNRFQIPFDFSYEIDIWGRVRRQYESAQAQMRASAYDMEVVRQTLLADLARNYFNLRSFDAEHQILTRNLDLYQEQADLTQNQYSAGLINEVNVLQATIQLESMRVQIADNRRQRANTEHAIAVLLGRAPADCALDFRPLEGLPPVVPAGLPADLLRVRPDVAESEQNLIAASAEIGVAQADFYPSIRLTGSLGFQSADLGDALDWKSRTASFGPSISLPIFQGGQLQASLRKAKARYDEQEAVYRKTVLAAFGDVEDSLTDLHLRSEASEAQRKAVEAAREYLRLTLLQYQTGIIDYLNVVNAEQTLVSNELSEVQLLNQRMVSTVLLIKALGGGWDPQAGASLEQSSPPHS